MFEEDYEWKKPSTWDGIKVGSWVRVNWWPSGTYRLGRINGRDVTLESGGQITITSRSQIQVGIKKEKRFSEHLGR